LLSQDQSYSKSDQIYINLHDLRKSHSWESQSASIEDQIKEIFYTSSSVDAFASNDEKEKFYYKYLGIYAKNYPQYFVVALRKTGAEPAEVLGYICGTDQTCSDHINLNPYYREFIGKVPDFPAHLHINCAQGSRGMGLGSKLLQSFEHLVSEKCSGIHLITTPESKNVSFYKKNGYNHAFKKSFKNHSLLMLAKKF